jgi:hypothetical protein
MCMIPMMPLLSLRCGMCQVNNLTLDADTRAMYKEVQGYFADGVSTFLTYEDDMLTIQLKVPDDGTLQPWT